MKKFRALLAFFLSCLMLLGSAVAEEPQVYTINLQEATAGYDGVWTDMGPFMLYLSDEMETVDAPAFDKDGAFSASYTLGNEALSIASTGNGYTYTVDKCVDLLRKMEKTQIGIVECDGRTFAGGDDADGGGSMVTWVDDQGKLFFFYYTTGDVETTDIFLKTVLSLTPTTKE